tara:strand:+ start:2342 stop:2557 length:216 start_codon:yes stop_codon:yes gene_type:complete
VQQLKIKQQQDIGLARCGKICLEEKKEKQKAELMRQVTTQSLLCVKDFLEKYYQDQKVVEQVNGQREKLKC